MKAKWKEVRHSYCSQYFLVSVVRQASDLENSVAIVAAHSRKENATARFGRVTLHAASHLWAGKFLGLLALGHLNTYTLNLLFYFYSTIVIS